MLILIACVHCVAFGQNKTVSYSELSVDSLNAYVLKEINIIRKRNKVDPLHLEKSLEPATSEFANYLGEKDKLTHFQRQKNKKSPKNRVDFFSGQFDKVAENLFVLQFDKKNVESGTVDVFTYEGITKTLMAYWKTKSVDFQNITSPLLSGMYLSVSLSKNKDKIYFCQLLASEKFEQKIEDYPYEFKPDNPKKCKRLYEKSPRGYVIVEPDSSIVFYSNKGIKSTAGIFNPFTDGFAADIVLKSQYPCNANNLDNGKRGVRGHLLKPVFLWKFRLGKGNYLSWFRYSRVVLGKLPAWVNEEYEVNLTVIKNNRTCISLISEIIPVDFKVEIPLNYCFDTLTKTDYEIEKKEIDTKMYFTKGQVNVNDSVIDQLKDILKQNESKIVKIEVKGYSSIEGSTEANQKLFTKRAQEIVDKLKEYGVDSTEVHISAEENFKDFRKDVATTSFAYLSKLTDAEIKNKLTDKSLVDKLESILKNHRFSEIKIHIQNKKKIIYDKELVNKLLIQNIEKDNKNEIKRLQSIQYGLAVKGLLSKTDIESIVFPATKKYVEINNNKAVINYLLDGDSNREGNLFNELSNLYSVDSTNRYVSSNLEIINYKDMTYASTKQIRKYLKKLAKKSTVLNNVKAKIVLNLSAKHDLKLYFRIRKLKSKHYLYKKSMTQISQAKLTPEETFDLATYYTFCDEEKFAYNLTLPKLEKTERLKDMLFFLKLIHVTDLKLDNKKYYYLFKKVKKLSGERFCTLFNSPNLNFQILDDEEIKQIYCTDCTNGTY